MKNSLNSFCKRYMELPEHAHLIQEGRDKNLSFYDILFNNSSVSIIWNKGQSFTRFILQHQHDSIEIEEDMWWGQWAYSIKFSDGTHFTIYSEGKIKID